MRGAVVTRVWSPAGSVYNRGMLRAATTAVWCGLVLTIGGLAPAIGCDSALARRQRLASPCPLERVGAAVGLAEAGDAQAVDLLIGLLEDRDPGVRLYAILALERLCGTTLGYRYYDGEAARAAAVARWREARQRGAVALRSGPRPAPGSSGSAPGAR